MPLINASERQTGSSHVRSLYPRDVRVAIVCDNFSPHLTTRRDQRVGA